MRCHDKETSLYDRHIITKRKIDADGNYDTCGAVTLDGQFRVLEIDWHYPSLLDCDFERLDYKDVDWHLRHASIVLPVPFRRGDIVVDRTAFDQRPFVFDCLKFWDFSTLIEHGHVLGAERPKVTYRKFYDRVDYDCKDESYMSVLGWNMASTWYYEGGPQLLDYGHGVCKNYLNLEYYRKPLEGDFRLLEVVSRWVRGEMDLGLAIGNAALIAAEGRASTLRFELERVYHHGGII